MTHPAVIKATQLINVGDILGAEKALAGVAEKEGDNALVAVIEDVAPKDLLALIREFDSTKESVINLVVTPEQFARAVVLESQYAESTHARLHGMVNAVVHRDPEATHEFLQAIAEIEGGVNAMADYFSDYIEKIVQFALVGNFANDYEDTSRFEPETLPWVLEKIDLIHHSIGGAEDEDGSLSRGMVDDDYSIESDNSGKPNTKAHTDDDGWVATKSVEKPLLREEVADADWKETAWVLRYELPEFFEEIVATLCNNKKKLLEAGLAKVAPSVNEEESAI